VLCAETELQSSKSEPGAPAPDSQYASLARIDSDTRAYMLPNIMKFWDLATPVCSTSLRDLAPPSGSGMMQKLTVRGQKFKSDWTLVGTNMLRGMEREPTWDLCLSKYSDVLEETVVTREPTWDLCLSHYSDVEEKRTHLVVRRVKQLTWTPGCHDNQDT
jgi:hypothetical protein